MNYWKSIKDEFNNFYSVDMVRLSFTVDDDSLSAINQYFVLFGNTHIESYPINLGNYKYRNLFKLNYGDSSMVVGLCFNGSTREQMFHCFCEFNPNKVDCEQFWSDFHFIKSEGDEFSLVRWDCAIDVPVERTCFQLLKDNRHYECSLNSFADKTEYLGVRNKVGRFKLYNKQLEAKLDYPLTRLELTMDFNLNESFNRFPEIYFVNHQQSIVDLKDTDLVLYELLVSSPDSAYYFNRLGRDKKKKLKPYVFSSHNRFKFSFALVQSLYDCVLEYFT